MGYKEIGKNLSFADLAVEKSLEHNRNLKMMKKINAVVDWENIEAVLLEHYDVGKSKEGADAFSPLLLMKCMLLQKWFRIPSDPELENQINDRISFKKFLELSLDTPSPDHSTFSRFRKRISKKAMIELNSLVLNEFEKKGLLINEGIAVDARLVKSASKPLSNDELEDLRKKRNNPEGKLDKNGNRLKFCRDSESNWVVKNEKPHYGLKEHASVDVDNGFILATTLTPASESDSVYLPYLTIASCHTKAPIEKVYADKGYYGEPNSGFLRLNEIKDGIMRKDLKNAKLTDFEHKRNKNISKKRYIVEQYFGMSHLHDGAHRARFTTILKNIWDTMCRQMAFDIRRGVKLVNA